MAALVEKQVWTPAQGLAYAQQVQQLGRRAEAFGKLAPHLPPILLSQALEAARAIQSESYRARTLSTLAPHLPETLLPIALEAARAIQSEFFRATVLRNLAPRLPEILPEALEAARAIQDEYYRASALSGMVPQLKPSFDFSFWKESLRVLAYRDRKKLLGDISQLSSVIIALGGSKALAQTARAIQEVGRQWP